MSKLSTSRTREQQLADPDRIDSSAKAIAAAFPPKVAKEAKAVGEFIRAAKAAIVQYLARLPTSRPKRRAHRPNAEQKHPSSPHRFKDLLRHGLVGDLHEAYMMVRGDDPDLRGFKKTADVVLNAAGLRPISEHEQTYIRDQIKRFAVLGAAIGKPSRRK